MDREWALQLPIGRAVMIAQWQAELEEFRKPLRGPSEAAFRRLQLQRDADDKRRARKREAERLVEKEQEDARVQVCC